MMQLEAKTQWAFSHRLPGGAQLTLEPHEVHTLNPVPTGVRVVSGMAWVTWEGKDILLNPGQEVRFGRGTGEPVISAMGRRGLTIEMLGRP